MSRRPKRPPQFTPDVRAILAFCAGKPPQAYRFRQAILEGTGMSEARLVSALNEIYRCFYDIPEAVAALAQHEAQA